MIDSIFNFSSVSTTTNISPRTVAMSDRERLDKLAFHIETDDYFRFLATLLGFVEETLAGEDRQRDLIPAQIEAVKAARKDLQYLYDHYRIEPRS